MIKQPSLIAGRALLMSCQPKNEKNKPLKESGIYPLLAYYNNESEFRTGSFVH